MAKEPTPGPAARWPLIDAIRGIALVAMIVYHATWDLGYFGLTAIDAGRDPAWRWFAHLIAGTFLFLVGVGLVLGNRHGFRPKRYLRRLAMIVAAAAAVTLGTLYAMPDAFVYFGILHAIAAASVLGLAFVGAPVWLTAVAALLAFALPAWMSGLPVFERPELGFLGFTRVPRPSVDFVPVFPWFGVTLAGIAAARLLLVRPGEDFFRRWQPRRWPERLLALMGRWSLVVYLIHQPVLFGLVYLLALATPPDPAARLESFLAACTRNCVATGSEAGLCERYCRCLADGAREKGILDEVTGPVMSDAALSAFSAVATVCRAR